MDHYPMTAPHQVRFEVMHMKWLNLTFLHWKVDPAAVQAILPDDLTVDTFEGSAWVGLVPFQMEVQLPGGIPIPREGRFPETNVRTYVRDRGGTPGVWFCSLEAGRLSATVAARVTYGLPYFWANMAVVNVDTTWSYQSSRLWPGPRGAHSRVRVEAGDEITNHSPLERFLTARWGLFSTFLGRTVYAPIVHERWPLHTASGKHLDDGLMLAAGFAIPDVEPLVHWSPGVDVRVGRPRRAS